ncbi:YceI family protein [Streptomyces thermodiastaticus]|jgi:polyisoprenoid-binding protein YceI|uniref:YceI family protein n=1 Tax=Streptomyces thermodiastaticus TaxID=44061 RepID=UPI0016766819|nr:YceI family protein [Streptomyces thermodiastaticus]MCE7550546.1 YceI family protein [Streptomyces thermodiastaticus]GHE24489.1 hypothetical protein GCM10018787_54420 [Streptomyces thermodiastaticus]
MALTAKIRTRDGWAIPHAVVTVTDTTGTQVLRIQADQDGTIHDTTPLNPGPYTVIITAVGYTPTAATALVTASGHAHLGTHTLTRQGGTELPPPGPWTIDPAHSTIAATAHHLGISSIHGRFTDFTGTIHINPDDINTSHVTATINTNSINTGNTLRDQHLTSPDFLDTENHPHITYTSTHLTPTGPDHYTCHGHLTLHGHTRPIDLDLTYLGTGPDPWGGTRAAFRATTELHREDFAMNYNQILQAGIAAIGTTLKIELDIQAVQGTTLPTT